jgi:thiamine-phosphate pyrophosphorylase
MKPLAACRLYGFVDSAYLHGREPESVARALCDGGVDLIQIRAKEAPVDSIRRWIHRIEPWTRAAGVHLVINDFPELALECAEPFCHLGQEDFFDRGYRQAEEVWRERAVWRRLFAHA